MCARSVRLRDFRSPTSTYTSNFRSAGKIFFLNNVFKVSVIKKVGIYNYHGENPLLFQCD